MFFVLGTLLVIIFSIKIASLLSVIFLMIYFRVKRYFQKMTEDKWQIYFEKIGMRGIFLRIMICYWLALAILAYFNMILFWQNSLTYGITMMVAGIFHVVFKYFTKKNEFKEMMNNRFK